jgi:hypothetical protein
MPNAPNMLLPEEQKPATFALGNQSKKKQKQQIKRKENDYE